MSGIEQYFRETEMNNLNAQWEMSYFHLRAIAPCFLCASIVLCSHIFFRSSFNSQILKFRYERVNTKPCCGKHHALLSYHNNWTGEWRMANYKLYIFFGRKTVHFEAEKKSKQKFRNYK